MRKNNVIKNSRRSRIPGVYFEVLFVKKWNNCDTRSYVFHIAYRTMVQFTNDFSECTMNAQTTTLSGTWGGCSRSRSHCSPQRLRSCTLARLLCHFAESTCSHSAACPDWRSARRENRRITTTSTPSVITSRCKGRKEATLRKACLSADAQSPSTSQSPQHAGQRLVFVQPDTPRLVIALCMRRRLHPSSSERRLSGLRPTE